MGSIRFFLVFITVLVSLHSVLADTSGLSVFFTFENSTGTAVNTTDFYKINNASINGTGTASVAGFIGTGANFSGAVGTFIYIPYSQYINFSKPFTIEFWLKATRSTTIEQYFSQYNTTSNQRGVSSGVLSNPAQSISFTLPYPDGSNINSSQTSNTSNGANKCVNSWCYLVYTWNSSIDGGEQKIYMNGTEVSYTSLAKSLGSANPGNVQALWIGNYHSASRPLAGVIDNFGITPYVLTDAQINTRFNNYVQGYLPTDTIPNATSSTLYVGMNNPACSDSYNRTNASSASTPWCTLQYALDNLIGGDTLYIQNGTYRDVDIFDFDSKTLTNLTTIAGAPGNTAVITSAYSTFETTPNSLWTNISNSTHNMWTASLSSGDSYRWITYGENGTVLFSHDTYADLVNLSMMQGFYFDASTIYIRFSAATANPNNINLSISKKAALNIQHTNGALLLANLTFRDSVKGIYISNSTNITLRNITIRGGVKGVDVTTGENITIIDSEFYMNRDSNWDWTSMKGSDMETTAIWSNNVKRNLNISRNTAHGHFNGIMTQSTNSTNMQNTVVMQNVIYNNSDDGIEIETYCNNATYAYNNLTYSFVALSISPVNASLGMCNISHNLLEAKTSWFYNRPSTYYYGEAIKSIYANPYTTNLSIQHNTLIGAGMYTSSSNNLPKNTNFSNNIYYSPLAKRLLDKSGLASNGVYYDWNIYYRTDGGAIFRYWNSDTSTTEYTSLAAALASSQSPGTWDAHSLNINPVFQDSANGDYRPATNSPACGNASDGTDIGAFACIPPDAAPYEPINASMKPWAATRYDTPTVTCGCGAVSGGYCYQNITMDDGCTVAARLDPDLYPNRTVMFRQTQFIFGNNCSGVTNNTLRASNGGLQRKGSQGTTFIHYNQYTTGLGNEWGVSLNATCGLTYNLNITTNQSDKWCFDIQQYWDGQSYAWEVKENNCSNVNLTYTEMNTGYTQVLNTAGRLFTYANPQDSLSMYEVVLANDSHFINTFFDLTYSNASTVTGLEAADGGGSDGLGWYAKDQYELLISGRSNLVQERLWTTFSPHILDVLPTPMVNFTQPQPWNSTDWNCYIAQWNGDTYPTSSNLSYEQQKAHNYGLTNCIAWVTGSPTRPSPDRYPFSATVTGKTEALHNINWTTVDYASLQDVYTTSSNASASIFHIGDNLAVNTTSGLITSWEHSYWGTAHASLAFKRIDILDWLENYTSYYGIDGYTLDTLINAPWLYNDKNDSRYPYGKIGNEFRDTLYATQYAGQKGTHVLAEEGNNPLLFAGAVHGYEAGTTSGGKGYQNEKPLDYRVFILNTYSQCYTPYVRRWDGSGTSTALDTASTNISFTVYNNRRAWSLSGDCKAFIDNTWTTGHNISDYQWVADYYAHLLQYPFTIGMGASSVLYRNSSGSWNDYDTFIKQNDAASFYVNTTTNYTRNGGFYSITNFNDPFSMNVIINTSVGAEYFNISKNGYLGVKTDDTYIYQGEVNGSWLIVGESPNLTIIANYNSTINFTPRLPKAAYAVYFINRTNDTVGTKTFLRYISLDNTTPATDISELLIITGVDEILGYENTTAAESLIQTVTTFNDSTSSGNITIGTNLCASYYIDSIPQGSNIYKAQLNLSKQTNESGEYALYFETPDTYSYTTSFGESDHYETYNKNTGILSITYQYLRGNSTSAKNITFPYSNINTSSCWNASNTTLQIRGVMWLGIVARMECYNGSNWLYFGETDTGTDFSCQTSGTITTSDRTADSNYATGMYPTASDFRFRDLLCYQINETSAWKNYPTTNTITVTVSTPSVQVYENSSLNTTWDKVDLNATAIENILSNSSVINITFCANNGSILSYKDIYITYSSIRQVNITASYLNNGTAINTFNATLTNNTLGYAYSMQTTNGFAARNVTQNTYYTMEISALNKQYSNYTLIGEQDYQFTFTLAHHNWTFIDSSNGTVISPNCSLQEQYLTTGTQFYTFDHTGNATMTCSLFPYANVSRNIDLDNFTQNYTIAMGFSNLQITFKDENSLEIVNWTTITADLVGVYNASNFTTTSGTLNISAFYTGAYELRYDAAGYTSRVHYFNIEATDSNSITVYLLNASIAYNITNTLYDEYINTVQGFYIKLLKYYIATNSYVQVDMGKTDTQGVTILSATLNDDYYKFVITDQAGRVYSTSDSSKIFATSLSHFIARLESISADLEVLRNLRYSLTFDNTTNLFRFQFENVAGTDINATLKVYKSNYEGDVLVNISSIIASSGILYAGISPELENTYTAKAYLITGDGEDPLMGMLEYFFGTKIGIIGLFLSSVITLGLVFGFVSNPPIAILMIPTGLIITKIAHLHSLGMPVIIAVAGLAFVIMYLIRDQS